MEQKIPKKLIALLIAIFLMLAVSLSLLFFFLRDGRYGGVFLKPSLSMSIELLGEELWQEEKEVTLPGGEHTLTIRNSEKETLNLCFFADDTLLGEISVKRGEETSFRFHLEEPRTISALIYGKGVSLGRISHSSALEPITARMPQGGDLIFYGDVECPPLTLSAPFRFFGSFEFQELSLETEMKGNIVMCPREEFQGDLYISAPNCQVYFQSFSLRGTKAECDYYIKAKALNGSGLKAESFPVSSFDRLERLANDEKLPVLSKGANITVLSPFSMEDSLSLSGHVSLVFQNAVDFDGHTLTLTAEDMGEFRVVSGTGSGPNAASLIFEAPDSSLIWETDGTVATIPALTTVEKYSNLASYNGIPTTVGGKGRAIPSVLLPAAENSFLSEDVEFLPQGNLLVAMLPYQISAADLNHASYVLSASEGSVTLEGDLARGRIVTVDEQGQERRFALEVRREVNHIPVLYLETEGSAEITSKSQYQSATFHLDGEGCSIPSLAETHIRIRGRGNSTWKWEKKPYKIHFDEPTSILGLPAAEEWALFANYADKSLMRNRLAQKMASVLSFEYCPTQEYVDLFVNGEYMGVYTIGEHLEEGVGRVEVEHDMTQMDCGYFLEAGGVVSGVDVKGMNYFHAGLVKFVLVKGPEYNTLTSEQFDYIKDYMQAADLAVKSGEGYEEYLDMKTLVDWLIMIELSNNTDCAWRRSTYFTKNPGEKLQMGPVWDFDLAFGNFSKDVEGFNTWVSTSEDDYVGETWSTHLLEDAEFRALFKIRWEEVKDQLLEIAMTTIDEDFQLLYPSARENFERWDILGKKVAFERHDTKNYKTYSSQIQYLKDFLVNRAAWIDSQVEAW